MASSNEEWFDEISRSNGNEQETTFSENNTTQSGQHESFYGFHDLDYANLYLYRVLNPLESIEDGIRCKDPSSDRTAEQHIASGSTKGSKFISTTLSSKVAAQWAFYEMDILERIPRETPLQIVKINVQVLVGTPTEKNCINLCDDEVREHFIKGYTHRSRAKSSKEVLFQYKIPKFVRESDKVSSNIQQPIFYPQSVHTVPQANNMFSTVPYGWNCPDEKIDKKLVYYVTTDIKIPSPPAAKKSKKKKEVSLEEVMAKLNPYQ